ncbi:hypothetical protein D910_05521 [Dendroctonus ponderosae]|uniref:Arf-GAP domain-containing protein n=1 Tax=Dendroctonus ponderosae TaxID=77166 RepID=U4U708_DENPD|nr:hypothetical protein D910_05521 [Dendroctonus ponderosae]
MATFSLDEIETLRSKGNGFCKKVWLGLYEGTPPIFSDEQLVRDFMIEKYEKKSSSTPNTGSAYGSPSPQSSIFGSPSQGQFMSAFNNLQENNSQIVNPFGISQSSSPWSVGNGFSNGYSNGPNGLSGMNALNSTQSSHGQINPFQDQLAKSNGLSNGVQSLFPSDGMKGSWSGNPFKLGTVSSSMNINNPFL